VAADGGRDGEDVAEPAGEGGTGAELGVGEPEDDGDRENGDGLADEAHATTSNPTAIVAATGANEERIRCPPDGVYQRQPTAPLCCVRHLSPSRHATGIASSEQARSSGLRLWGRALII
jgi:hypothetical protein